MRNKKSLFLFFGLLLLSGICSGGVVKEKQTNSKSSSSFKENRVVSNNICENSIPLTVNSNNECTPTTFDNIGATDSGTEPEFSCALGASKDVWFQLSIPTNGKVTIETKQVTNGLLDMEMQAYTGTCSNLIEVACNADDGDGRHAKLELTNREQGEIIYLRITDFLGNEEGQFGICAYSDAPAVCGCNGVPDTESPVITGFNPNAAWMEKGTLDENRLSINFTDYDGLDLFEKEDILLSDNCTSVLEINLSSANIEGSIPGDCSLVDKYTWSVIDDCNNVTDTSLFVTVYCNFDVKSTVESNFIDTRNEDFPEFTDIKPNSTIFVPCGTTDSELEELYGHIRPDTLSACNASSPPSAKRTKKKRLKQNNSCLEQEWEWEIKGACSSNIGFVSLYFVYEGCNNNQIINDNPIPSGTYNARQYIQSAGIVNNEKVIFKAEEYILLESGFTVKTTGEFFASIETITCQTTNSIAELLHIVNDSPAEKMSTLRCYPNPTSHTLTVACSLFEEQAILGIYNFEGQRMLEKIVTKNNMPLSQKINLDVSNFPNGFYYINLRGNSTLVSEKVIILRK